MSDLMVSPTRLHQPVLPTTNPDPATKQQLFSAEMAELCHRARSDQAKALTAQTLRLTLEHEAKHHPRRQKWREADLLAFEQGLGAFLADLLIHAANEASGGTTFRSTSRQGFSGTLCSSRHFERLVTFWSEMEWIEVYPGFRLYGDFDGRDRKRSRWQRRVVFGRHQTFSGSQQSVGSPRKPPENISPRITEAACQSK